MRLLSVGCDAKTVKGEKKGYLTGILYLAPASSSGVANVCASASAGCIAGCLNTAGRASIFPAIHKARVRKTRALFADRDTFMRDLERDINALVRAAKRKGMTPCVRVNGTSDLPWLALEMAHRFPRVQFYDYTKHARPWDRVRSNYHLTFSHSEINESLCVDALRHGINVAMVFSTRKGQPLPKRWNGYRVIDGDLSDLRFTDPRGVIVGLRAKGRAKRDYLGFCVKADLVQIQIGKAA